MKAWGAISMVVLLSIVPLVFSAEEQGIPSIYIGDGSGLSAVEALDAAAVLTTRSPGLLQFATEDGNVQSFMIEGGDDSGICMIRVDFLSLEVLVGGYAMDETRMDFSEIVDGLKEYGKAADLTKSRPVFALSASNGVGGEKLVKLLRAAAEVNEAWTLYLSRSDKGKGCPKSDASASTSRFETNSPRRQAERLPYKIDFEN